MSSSTAHVAGRGTTRDEIIGAGGSWSGIVRSGEVVTITDLQARQGVDFHCYCRESPEERYHAVNTIKKARTLRLTTGHVLYADAVRPIMTIIEDTCGWNDTVAGCCSVPSNQMLYGAESEGGCRENFLTELQRHNLGRRDIVANLNFFCRVPVLENNSLDASNLRRGARQSGRSYFAASRDEHPCRSTIRAAAESPPIKVTVAAATSK